MAGRYPDDGRCLCEKCCWARVQEAVEAEKKRTFTIPELSQEYGLSESLLYKLARKNDLVGCRRMGGRFVIDRKTFTEWLKAGGKHKKEGDGE